MSDVFSALDSFFEDIPLPAEPLIPYEGTISCAYCHTIMIYKQELMWRAGKPYCLICAKNLWDKEIASPRRT